MDRESRDTDESVFDLQELVNRCLGNIEFAERVLAKFQARFGDDIAEIERAVMAEDADTVASVAHRLKGASATAAAKGIQNQAAEIEQLARKRNMEEIPGHLQKLRNEWSRFAESASLAGASSGAV
jgi:HPt (histidine-containing phosphotransfer) domain-containing protein